MAAASPQNIIPINMLKPYQNKWVIKARVFNKSDILTWSNNRGKGKRFNMVLRDESGEILATAFNDECDKFYNIIQIDKVYCIRRCQVKLANKKFNRLKNDYEIIFGPITEVVEYTEDSASMPTVNYDFTTIDDIGSKTIDSTLDVIGVCHSASEVQEVTFRRTGEILKKRDLTLVDTSGSAIVITLWRKEAEEFEETTHPVISVKGARLTEFNGSKSLSCIPSTTIRKNPDLPQADSLRAWYDNGGAASISARQGFDTGSSNEWITFSDVEARQLGSGDKRDIFCLLGVVIVPSCYNVLYKACPQNKCNNKVQSLENGLFKCQKCDKEYTNYKYALRFTANVSDPTGNQEIIAFNESAEAMLLKNAAEIGSLFERDRVAYNEIFKEIEFKTFVFKLRTETDIFKGEACLRNLVLTAQPINYKDANTRMISSIKSVTGIDV